MSDTDARQDAAERVAETVRRALALVGPAERGAERSWSDDPGEEPAA
jgi:hypothetical protein